MNEARRYALNFHSYVLRRTVEYRLKEGTTDPATLLYWPLFCGLLTEWLASQTPKTLFNWRKEILSYDWMVEQLDEFHPKLPKGLLEWLQERGQKPIVRVQASPVPPPITSNPRESLEAARIREAMARERQNQMAATAQTIVSGLPHRGT